MEIRDLDTFRSITELRAYQAEVRARMTAMHVERAGLPFDEDGRTEFAALRAQDTEIDARVAELEARDAVIADIAAQASSVEGEGERPTVRPTARRSSIPAGRVAPAQARPRNDADLWDLSQIRMDFERPEVARGEFRDRAMRVLDQATLPRFGRGIVLTSDRGILEASEANLRDHIAYLLDEKDSKDGSFARRVVLTSSPIYQRAFAKKMTNQPTSHEEERALSLVTTEGGFAVPITIDPTVLPTSNLSVSPWRAICSVEQIVGTEWRGLTAGAVVASYADEGAEATDDAPTLGQPTISVIKAHTFIPFSIEIGMDWSGMQQEMARLIQEAKDDLEADQFFTGGGTLEPDGLNSMSAGTNVTTITGGAFVYGDLGKLDNALAPRARSRASMVGNRTILNLVRGFDPTFGLAAGVFGRQALGLANNVPTPGNVGTSLFGYQAYESTAMSAVLSGSARILLLGDFSRYKIIDRVGLSVEVIPHLFHVDNNRPSGERGIYAYWRNNGKPINESAFKFLRA